MISIDDFKKIELKVVKIIEAEKVEGSEKLLKLKVQDGKNETGEPTYRQLVSGIAKYYLPQELIGKNIVIVANLEPRNLMGIKSNGMIVAAEGESGPVLVIPEKDIPAGAKII